jgi:hypothetical protein
VAAGAGTAPIPLAARDQAGASFRSANGGEGRNETAGAHLCTAWTGDLAIGLVHRQQHFETRLAILAPILVKWHWHTPRLWPRRAARPHPAEIRIDLAHILMQQQVLVK